jgi:NAD+ kinase
MVPLAAHALFARPLVVSPDSVLAVELVPNAGEAADVVPERPPDAALYKASEGGGGSQGSDRAVLWCDGRRRFELPPGARVELRRGALPVSLARVHGLTAGSETGGTPAGGEFTDRLVAKFGLPVAGWRGRPGPRR